MSVIARVAGCTLAVFAVGCSGGSSKESKKPAQQLSPHTDDKFAPGQVWKFSGSDANERLVILRVEHDRTGSVIIHIAVENTAVGTAEGQMQRIGHLPFAREAVASSVTELDGKAELPDFEEGYGIWRKDFLRGKAGVFTIAVGEAVAGVRGVAAQQN